MNLKQLLAMGCFAIAPYTSWAQGIIVHMTDGTEVRYKASEVESITTFGGSVDTEETKDMVFKVGDVEFKMIYVEGGSFMMGATPEQGDNIGYDELPIHDVQLSSFYIGETEVTQGLWESVMGVNLSSGIHDPNKPVQNITWTQCNEFIDALSNETGMQFSLPTEAQWEYAARGGSKSKGYKFAGGNKIEDIAWYFSNSNDTVHAVATKLPNELQLYDMTGNVWEWCYDYYDGDYYSSSSSINPQGPKTGNRRVYRGGGFRHNANNSRLSLRNHNEESFSYSDIGLRLVLLSKE